MQRRVPIGEMLIGQGRIDAAQLQSALAHQRRWGGRLGHALVHLGFVREADLLRAVAEQLGVPFIEIGDRYVPPSVVKLVPERLLRLRRAFPLSLTSESPRAPLLVAFADPADLASIDEVAFAAGMMVKPVLAAERDIERALARHLGGEVPAPAGTTPPDAIELPKTGDEPMNLVERPHTPRTFH